MTLRESAIAIRRSALGALGPTPVLESPSIRLTEVGPWDAWVVRGPGAADAVRRLSRGSLPVGRRSTVGVREGPLELWALAADEILVFAEPRSGLETRIDSLASDDASVVEMTGGWTMLRLDGTGAPALMTELCPVDTSPAALAGGALVQAPLVGVRAVIARDDEPEPAYRLLVACDEARYAWDAISHLAKAGARS